MLEKQFNHRFSHKHPILTYTLNSHETIHSKMQFLGICGGILTTANWNRKIEESINFFGYDGWFVNVDLPNYGT